MVVSNESNLRVQVGVDSTVSTLNSASGFTGLGLLIQRLVATVAIAFARSVAGSTTCRRSRLRPGFCAFQVRITLVGRIISIPKIGISKGSTFLCINIAVEFSLGVRGDSRIRGGNVLRIRAWRPCDRWGCFTQCKSSFVKILRFKG